MVDMLLFVLLATAPKRLLGASFALLAAEPVSSAAVRPVHVGKLNVGAPLVDAAEAAGVF